jgi:hypothetical protein
VDLDPFNVRRGVGLVTNARRGLLPLPLVDRPGPIPAGVLPPFAEREPLGELAVAASAGGGAGAALIGVARVFEEAATRPVAVAACSASVLWAVMWAGGMSSDEMLEDSLGWRPEGALGVQWIGLPRLALSAARGFSGLARAAALEQLLPRQVWRMSAGETDFPLHVLARDLDSGRLERLGTETTPELTLGELARVAVTPPRRGEAVRIEGRFLVDAADPEGVRGMVAGDALVEPPRGGGFYDLFLDRRGWPEHIRAGYDATRRRRPASPSRAS